MRRRCKEMIFENIEIIVVFLAMWVVLGAALVGMYLWCFGA